MLKSALRITAVIAVLSACYWVAIQYIDQQAFAKRNPRAMAYCGSLKAGSPSQDAASRARTEGATVATLKDSVVVRLPRESICLVRVNDGKIESAGVLRNY